MHKTALGLLYVEICVISLESSGIPHGAISQRFFSGQNFDSFIEYIISSAGNFQFSSGIKREQNIGNKYFRKINGSEITKE